MATSCPTGVAAIKRLLSVRAVCTLNCWVISSNPILETFNSHRETCKPLSLQLSELSQIKKRHGSTHLQTQHSGGSQADLCTSEASWVYIQSARPAGLQSKTLWKDLGYCMPECKDNTVFLWFYLSPLCVCVWCVCVSLVTCMLQHICGRTTFRSPFFSAIWVLRIELRPPRWQDKRFYPVRRFSRLKILLMLHDTNRSNQKRQTMGYSTRQMTQWHLKAKTVLRDWKKLETIHM